MPTEKRGEERTGEERRVQDAGRLKVTVERNSRERAGGGCVISVAASFNRGFRDNNLPTGPH